MKSNLLKLQVFEGYQPLRHIYCEPSQLTYEETFNNDQGMMDYLKVSIIGLKTSLGQESRCVSDFFQNQ